MLTLNLVSSDIKREIKLRRIFVFSKGLLHILIYFTIIFTVAIAYAKNLIDIKLHNIEQQISNIEENSRGYNQKVTKLNSLIVASNDIQKDHTSWTCFLAKLFSFSDSVTLSTIHLSKSQQDVFIKGRALKREDLLEYKSTLEKSGYFENISLPLNDLLNKENIEFQITAKFNVKNINNLKTDKQ